MTAYKNSDIRILVVDDALKNIQFIGKLLRRKGFLVSVAQSGVQALDILEKSHTDLILLDIIMPGMDGMETCRRIKNNPDTTDIPVVFLSALSESSDKVRGLKAGAVDYVTKPIDSEELLARIKLHLTMKALQDDLESQVEIRTRELSKVNEALKKREEDYRSVMKAVADPIIVYDLDMNPLYINPAFTRVFGWRWSDLGGRRPDYVVEGEEKSSKDAFDRAIKYGHLADFHSRRYTKDGQILDVNISAASYRNNQGKVAGVVFNLRDITEWNRTQEVMVQNEKMMSLGGLAAGMAHEIKNPLSVIIQDAQIIRNRLFKELPANIAAAQEAQISFDSLKVYLKNRKIDNFLDRFQEAGVRLNTIIDNMLSFSKNSESRQLSCDLKELMDKAVDLASQDYDLKKSYDFRNINIQRTYDDTLPMIPCEASKIEQVFFNILRNGGEAMHQAGTQNPEFILTICKENENVCIQIQDNGPGMTKEIRKRIFEPFFTTKEADAGTGLGLSVSYFIICQGHGGDLQVSSHPGKGTTFSISLPIDPKTPGSN